VEQEREQHRPQDRADERLQDRHHRHREERGDDEAENARVETVVGRRKYSSRRERRSAPGIMSPGATIARRA
jgi:hypothetical protein